MLLIRADANETMGAGHVMRCIALAQEWQKNHGDVLFLSSCPPAIDKKINSFGFSLLKIKKACPCESDLKTTIKCIKENHASWIVVDGYHFTPRYHKAIKATGVKLLILDYYNHLPEYNADLILNQNLWAQSFEYNIGKDGIPLLGNRFVMLRNEFETFARPPLATPDKAKKILVTTGGADPDNLTLKIIQALNQTKNARFKIKIIIGPANPNIASIEKELAPSLFAWEVISNTTKMPELMGWADLAISAGGSTAWELSYFGVPAFFIIMAENQKKIVQALESYGGGINAGCHTQITPDRLALDIIKLAEDHDRRNKMSISGRTLITHKGRKRVALAMASFLKSTKLTITILSDKGSWITPFANRLKSKIRRQFSHSVRHIHSVSEIRKGDIIFYLGCGQLVPNKILNLNTHNLVVHESDLPKGKGWSPMTWQILGGKNQIPITLLEAVEKVDSGPVYLQEIMDFKGHELVDELRQTQGNFSIRLCLNFLSSYPVCLAGAKEQEGKQSIYPRRTPRDSKLDINRSLTDQFNLMRVADNERYPLFFELDGHTFQLKITRSGESNDRNKNK